MTPPHACVMFHNPYPTPRPLADAPCPVSHDPFITHDPLPTTLVLRPRSCNPCYPTASPVTLVHLQLLNTDNMGTWRLTTKMAFRPVLSGAWPPQHCRAVICLSLHWRQGAGPPCTWFIAPWFIAGSLLVHCSLAAPCAGLPGLASCSQSQLSPIIHPHLFLPHHPPSSVLVSPIIHPHLFLLHQWSRGPP